ncbi:MAG: hypothetical protein MR019_04635 [Ruminococcus sp.]|nr:hypothetical protein [Ruminococcus sp.]MDY3895445.1 hypothetical protein [Candidatus Fimenecus sp.]
MGLTHSSPFAYTYADKTNYLAGVKHKFALDEQTVGYRYGNLSIGEMPDQIYGVTRNGIKKEITNNTITFQNLIHAR